MKKINLLLLMAMSSLIMAGCNSGGTTTSTVELPISQGWNILGGNNNVASGTAIIKINPQTNMLYAAGSVYESNYSVGVVNQWNGISWSQLGNYILGYVYSSQQMSGLLALALNPLSGELSVGGWNTGVYQNSSNSQYWSLIGLDFIAGSYISSLATGTNGTLYAINDTRTYMYSDFGVGKQWYTIGQNSAAISNVGVDNLNNVFGTTSNESGGGVWKYNSQTDLWVQLGNYFPGTAQQIAFSNNGGIYVGSSFESSSFTEMNGGVWTWNGSNWALLGGEYIPDVERVSSITVDDSGNVYASGYSTNGGGVWKWNGSSWSQIGGAGTMCDDWGNVGSVSVDTIGNVYAVCGNRMIGGNVYVHKP